MEGISTTQIIDKFQFLLGKVQPQYLRSSYIPLSQIPHIFSTIFSKKSVDRFF